MAAGLIHGVLSTVDSSALFSIRSMMAILFTCGATCLQPHVTFHLMMTSIQWLYSHIRLFHHWQFII